MKKNFNLDDLDTFLSEAVEEHRMYPSDRVWRNIDQELHGNKRWPALTFGAVLTGAILIAGLILTKPDKNLFAIELPQMSSVTEKPALQEQTEANFIVGIEKENTKKIKVPAYSKVVGTPTVSFYTGVVLSSTDEQDQLTYISAAAKKAQLVPMVETTRAEINLHPSSNLNSAAKSVKPLSSITDNETEDHFALMPPIVGNIGIENDDAFISEESAHFSGKDLSTASPLLKTGKDVNNKSATQTEGKKKSRWSIQYFATPSISYRYLDEAKIVDLHLAQNGPIAPNLTNGVNNFVRHKSSIGLEAGSVVMFDVTPNFRIKGGLQLNYRSYNIDAFAASTERSTIVLDRGSNTDSLILYSSISNLAGFKAIELTNKYYQVAVPLGFDLKMAGSKKMNFYVGATVAPTYQFNKSVYVISTDYKNYMKQPDLVRNFNLNAAIEAFVTYKVSPGTTLQAGPQLRYQMLSGTTKQYPIREHLMDFGLKVGVVKTLK
jgi:hypothetical protein